MGKASKWFRGLFGGKKPEPNLDPSTNPTSRKKWRFSKSRKEKDRQKSQQSIAPAGESDSDGGAAVVRLRNNKGRVTAVGNGGGLKYSTAYVSWRGTGYGSREVRAAVTIQSHFRAYLSRRALHALKALVKLQALVRGHILRKQMANYMRQLQALARAQARARANRVLNFKHAGPGTPQRTEQMINARSMKLRQHRMPKRSASKSSGNVTDDAEKSHLASWERTYNNFTRIIPMDDRKPDKILEVDTWRPRTTPRHRHIFHSSDLSHSSDQYCQSFSDSTARQTTLSGDVQSFIPFKHEVEESTFYTPESSPHFYSGGSTRRDIFTPNKAEGFRSGYSDHPNYMAYTESSKAKTRSISAPKQRPHYEAVYAYGQVQKDSALHANFVSKAYPGSGRLDRLGMPVGGDGGGGGFSGPWHRY